MGKSQLLEQISTELRTGHYSRRTEQAYSSWIKRYILFHNKKHPKEMGADEIKAIIQDVRLKWLNLLFTNVLSLMS